MDVLLLPDFLAMAVLLGVLAIVRRRYPQHNISLWMSGLVLILLEAGARLLYGLHLSTPWHRAVHSFALDAYLVAGVLFLRSSLPALRRMPRSTVYLVLNLLPAGALMTVYASEVRSVRLVVGITVLGALVGVTSSLVMRRSSSHLVALLALWLPAMAAALAHLPRWAVYLQLSVLYFLVALSFFSVLPARSSGKIAVVLGFAMWAVCFATHPWLAQTYPQWVPLASEIWNMQKFLITVGFLLVLFERQVDSNEWLALHDQLTGLPNRRLFEDRIGSAVARAERDRTGVILFAMDLNRFKEVNDTLGHDAGDALLQRVSEKLQNVVRRTDTLARLGGDEFVLLATDVKGIRDPRAGAVDAEAQSLTAAERMHLGVHPVLRHARRIENDLRRAFDNPVLLDADGGRVAVEVGMSIGVAVYPTDSTNLAELARIADQRMYEDKRRQHASSAGMETMLGLLSAS